MGKLVKRISLLTLLLLSFMAFTISFASFNTVKGVAGVNSPSLTSFTTITGAEVRTDSENPGIRFTAEISATEYNNIKDSEGFEIGMAIARTNSVTALKNKINESAENASRILKAKEADKWVSGFGPSNAETDTYKYTFAIIGFGDDNLNVSYTALGYVKVNGEIYYSSIENDTASTRTPFQVAVAHMTALPDDDLDYAYQIADKVLGGENSSQLTFDSTNYELNVGANATPVVKVGDVALSVNVVPADETIVKFENNKLTGIKAGKTTVSVTVKGVNTNYTATANVTVRAYDSTNKFSWTDSTTSVTQTANGYEIRAVGGSTIDYVPNVELPDGEFITIKPLGGINTIVITLTNITDSTRGSHFTMFNGVGFGGPGNDQAYYNLYPLSTDLSTANFADGSNYGVNTVYPLSDTNAEYTYRYSANGYMLFQIPTGGYTFVGDTNGNNFHGWISNDNRTVKMSIRFIGNTAQAGIAISSIANENLKLASTEKDSTNKFSWTEDDTTSVTKTDKGYEIRAVGGTTINYLPDIDLPDGEIFTIKPLGGINTIVITLTNVNDSTRGCHFTMFNGVDYGGTGIDVAYYNLYSLSTDLSTANFVNGSHYGATSSYPLSNTNTAYTYRYSANGYMFLQDPAGGSSHTFAGDLSGNNFHGWISSDNKKVKMSITFIGNTVEAGIAIEKIVDESFTAA